VAGAVLIGPGLAGMQVSPKVPQTDYAVAANFERFDGLDNTAPSPNGGPTQFPNNGGETETIGSGLDHPASFDPLAGGTGGGGTWYGWNVPGHSPRPGQSNTPAAEQVYTEGPLQGTVGVVGGQPLPVSPRIYKSGGAYTKSRTPSIQRRLGVGQHGPSELGVAQTVQLSEITNAPPQPGDLTSILAGLG
jgi:hypothetical protein